MKRLAASLLLASLPATGFAATVVNGDFETDADLFVAWPGYVGFTEEGVGTNPATITGWTVTNGVGLNPVVPGDPADSPFDDPSTWNGTHFALLQNVASIEQVVPGFLVGTEYVLTLDFNARGCCGDSPVATVSFNGTPVASSVDLFGGNGAIPTALDPDPWYRAEIPFTAPAETITLTISSASAAGGDATLVVDNVAFAVVPEPSGAALLALGMLGLAARRRGRGRPCGPA